MFRRLRRATGHWKTVRPQLACNILLSGFSMDPTNIQTPEEMLERWTGVECQCDPSVGHLCEVCHDTKVLRDVIKERDRLRDGIDFWSYCMSQGMRETCPEKVEELAAFLISCKVAPWYILPRGGQTQLAR